MSKVTKSSGNVFLDIGFEPQKAERLAALSDLLIKGDIMALDDCVEQLLSTQSTGEAVYQHNVPMDFVYNGWRDLSKEDYEDSEFEKRILYTTQLSNEVVRDAARYCKLKSIMLPILHVKTVWQGRPSDWTPGKDRAHLDYLSWENLEEALDKDIDQAMAELGKD